MIPLIFTGPNCAGCTTLKQALTAAGYVEDKHYELRDAMKFMPAARTLNVRGFPTTIFFDGDGKEVARYVGAAQVLDVVKKMEEVNVSG